MNTRVQVEHCVTEVVTGVDIVREQGILVAAGEPLSFGQDDIRCAATRSSAASTPRTRRRTSRPRPGTIGAYREPSGPGVRVDSGVRAGGEITPLYDPMVAKLIVWDADREQATRRMLRALEEFEIEGVKTLIPFHKAIMATEQWANARDLPRPDRGQGVAQGARVRAAAAEATADDEAETVEQDYTVEVSGRRFDVTRHRPAVAARRRRRQRRGARRDAGRRAARAQGRRRRRRRRHARPRRCRATCSRCWSSRAPTVEEGALVCIIEAMKMENEITAHKAGTIAELPIKEGDAVAAGATIAVIRSEPAPEG